MKYTQLVLTTLFLVLGFCQASSAASKPQLKVYTFGAVASKYGAGPDVKEAFEKTCNCEIQWVPVDTGLLLFNRLKWEGSKTKADVVMGLDSIVAKEALELNLFEPLGEPVTFGQSELIPYSRTCLSFIYDQNRVQEPPKSFTDLMSGRYKILMQDPRTSGTGTAMVVWVRQIFGDNAPAVWKKLDKNVLTYTRGWSEAYTMFQRGEGDLVLSYMSSPIYHEVTEGKTNYRACRFQEGNITLYEMVGIVKHSKQKDLGRQFINFLRSPEGQHILSTKGWQYQLQGRPKDWENLATYEEPGAEVMDTFSLDRNAWVDEWQKTLTR